MTSNQEIAIIDNGIKTEGIIGKAVVKQISFLNRSKMYKVPEHGTMCAQIINYIYPQARFIDLSIMESNGTTQIKKLLEALEWCIKNNIKLINLSMGTVNYFDIKSLKEVFDELQKKNVIVVAAYDNRNIKTFPAMFPGVFGVRQDREGILENQEFTFQEISKINTENTIVAHGWCNEGENHATMSFLQPLVIQQITDKGMVEQNLEHIIFFVIILVVVSTVYQITDLIQTKMFIHVHNGLMDSLYKKAYWKFEKLHIGYYIERGNTEILNMIGSDIGNISSVTDRIATLSIGSCLQIVGGIIGLSLLDWRLSLLIIAVIPLKFYLVSLFSNKKSKIFENYIENNRLFSRWLGDCVSGIREMKLWNLFQIKYKQFDKLENDILNSYRDNLMIDQYNNDAIQMLDTLVNAILYILSGILIVNGKFTIGTSFAFITYSGYVVTPISFLVNIKYYFAEIEPSAKRFFDFLQQPEECTGLYLQTNEKNENDYTVDKPVLMLKNVNFSYNSEKKIFDEVNINIMHTYFG